MKRLTPILLVSLLALAGCGSDVPSEPQPAPGSGASERPQSTNTGDEAIDGFGEEAEGEEREAIAAAAKAYLGARAEDRWAAACEHLSATTRRSVAQAAERLSGESRTTCPAALSFLQGRVARSLREEAAEGETAGVRVRAANAFYVYRVSGGMNALLVMRREGGEWRAGAPAGTLLPEPAGG